MTFIDLMVHVFKAFFLEFFVIFFIDDIIIYSRNTEKHEENLSIVLQTFKRLMNLS